MSAAANLGALGALATLATIGFDLLGQPFLAGLTAFVGATAALAALYVWRRDR